MPNATVDGGPEIGARQAERPKDFLTKTRQTATCSTLSTVTFVSYILFFIPHILVLV